VGFEKPGKRVRINGFSAKEESKTYRIRRPIPELPLHDIVLRAIRYVT
jgi:hypothetical protein